jgi:hypothetical protein
LGRQCANIPGSASNKRHAPILKIGNRNLARLAGGRTFPVADNFNVDALHIDVEPIVLAAFKSDAAMFTGAVKIKNLGAERAAQVVALDHCEAFRCRDDCPHPNRRELFLANEHR